jgi:hypothetical protein
MYLLSQQKGFRNTPWIRCCAGKGRVSTSYCSSTRNQPPWRKSTPPHTKQDLIDTLEKADDDAVEKDKCASKATKQAEDRKSVAEKERSEKKAAIKSKSIADKELISAQQDLAEERYNKSVAIADAKTAAKESLTAQIFFDITVLLTCVSLLSNDEAIWEKTIFDRKGGHQEAAQKGSSSSP